MDKKKNNKSRKKPLPGWAFYSILIASMIAIVFVCIILVGHYESHVHGFNTSDKVIQVFLKAFGDVDTVKMKQCVYDDETGFVKNNIDNALEMHDSIELNMDDMNISSASITGNDLTKLQTDNNKNITEAKFNKVELPMTQIINKKAYSVVQTYNITTVKIDEKWFIANIETVSNKIINSEDDDKIQTDSKISIPDTTIDYEDAISISLDDEYSKYIGNESTGYIKVGKDWKPYTAEGYAIDKATSEVDYVSADNSSILTIATLDLGDISLEEYGSNIYTQIADDSDAVNVTADEEKVGEYTAKRVFGYYSSDSIYYTMLLWKTSESDTNVHCLLLQFKPEHRNDYKYITTFTTKK